MAGWRDWGTRRGAACALALACFSAAQAFAQPAPSLTPVESSSSVPPGSKSRELADRRLELRGVEETLDAAEAQRRKLESDIEAIRTDRARLNAALIETRSEERR